VSPDPFDACWDRLDRLGEHRGVLAEIWNDFIDEHPYDFGLVHQGGGVHVLEVWQTKSMPPAFAIEFGEWLYNARACLDYIVWAASAYATGQLPPPDEGTLQYPVYESLTAWTRNEYRLKHLAPHHREMLSIMQPFNSDADANYLGVINRLARVDRHRRLTVGTAYLADVQPVIRIPAGCRASFEWGQRVLIDERAALARIKVTPWTDGTNVEINPRVGIDPEIGEWATSPFWRKIRFSERLLMIQIFLSAEIATYEYDCTGSSRKSDVLAPEYRAECDRRGPLGPLRRTPAPDVSWGAPSFGAPSTESRLRGEDYPSGRASADD